MTDFDEEMSQESSHNPQNLVQLLKHSMIADSRFHIFSLLSLETVIWNLDILIHILKLYDLQVLNSN